MKLAFLTTDNRQAHHQYDNPMPWFGTAMEAVLQGFRDLPDLEVHVVTCTQQPMHAPAKLADNIWFHSLVVPKLGWMRTLYSGCIRATRRKLHEIKPDIVHGQGTERDCSISAVHSGFPCVVTIHGNMAELARQFRAPIGSFNWLAGKLEDWTLPRAQGVFCNSAYTEKLVRARNPRSWRVPNALREAFFVQPLSHRAISSEPPRLINAGTITANKRQREILAVCRKLYEQGYVFRMMFVGRAHPDESYSREFLREMADPGAATFASFQGFQELPDLINTLDATDCAIHFPQQEAFGLVVAEALSRNLKFVGARTGGVIDICEGVETAELVDVDNLAGLETAIARWLEQGAPRPTSAARTMEERYHPRVIAQRHLEIYKEVLSAA